VAHPLAESLRDMSDTLNACGNDFSDILLDAARELDRRRWIPVTERLPERNEIVLVVVEGRSAVGSYSPMLGDWWVLQYGSMAPGPTPTHWMPLPAPPG
jgi:hypothetical protein